MDHVTTFKLNKVISLYLRSEIKEKKSCNLNLNVGPLDPLVYFLYKPE